MIELGKDTTHRIVAQMQILDDMNLPSSQEEISIWQPQSNQGQHISPSGPHAYESLSKHSEATILASHLNKTRNAYQCQGDCRLIIIRRRKWLID
jgi:hypothetical protein